jgi:outer membrane murein-binding lipoprotein Lpp
MGSEELSGELHELSAAIGALQAQVSILAQTVRDNQETSTEEHRKVHDIVVATSEAVQNLAAKVAKMEPLTDDYRERRAEARGAGRLIHVLYVTFGGTAAAFAMRALDWFSVKPPH